MVTEEEKAKEAEQKPLSDKLLEQFKKVLSEQVSEVRVSDRLTDSPSCLVIPDGGLDPYIERLLRAQQGAAVPTQKRILEVNTKHPLIASLAKLHERTPESSEVDEAIELVYDQALLSEGSPIEDPARVAKRLIKLLQASAEASLQR